MMTSTKEVEGIILSYQDYKDNDVLVSMLCEDEIVRFIAKGIHKPNAKNRMLMQPYTYVHLSLTGKSMWLCTTGHIIKSYFHIYEDLQAQSVVNVLIDCLYKTTINKDIFTAFVHVLDSFQNGLANVYTYCCILMKMICINEGIGMHVNDCVHCHRTNHIETISIRDGGFVCSSCNHGVIRKYSKEELIQYRSLFVYKKAQENQFIEYYTFTIDDFLFLMKWYMEHMSIQLKSVQFLNSILVL